MFICDVCLDEKYLNSPSLSRSVGRCEICGEGKECSDIKSRDLEPKEKLEEFPLQPERNIMISNNDKKPTIKSLESKEYPRVGCRYKHYKGGTYKVLSLAKHSETNEDMVVYKSIEFGSVHVRPLSMWFDVVGEVDKSIGLKLRRFELEIDLNITEVDYDDDLN